MEPRRGTKAVRKHNEAVADRRRPHFPIAFIAAAALVAAVGVVLLLTRPRDTQTTGVTDTPSAGPRPQSEITETVPLAITPRHLVPVSVVVTLPSGVPAQADIAILSQGNVIRQGVSSGGSFECEVSAELAVDLIAQARGESQMYGEAAIDLAKAHGRVISGSAHIVLRAAVPGHAIALRVLGPSEEPVHDFSVSIIPSVLENDKPFKPRRVTSTSHSSDLGSAVITGIKDDVVDMLIKTSDLCSRRVDRLDVSQSSFSKPLPYVVRLARGIRIFGDVQMIGHDHGLLELSVLVVPRKLGFTFPKAETQEVSASFAGDYARQKRAKLLKAGEKRPFQITGLDEGEYQICVVDGLGGIRSDIRSLELTSEADYGPIALEVTGGWTASLQVKWGGRPARCSATLEQLGENGSRPTRGANGLKRLVAVADDNGKLVSRGLAPGWYQVRVDMNACKVDLPGAARLRNWLSVLPQLCEYQTVIRIIDSDVDLGAIDLSDGVTRYEEWLARTGRSAAREKLARIGSDPWVKDLDDDWFAARGVTRGELGMLRAEGMAMGIEGDLKAGRLDVGKFPPEVGQAIQELDMSKLLRFLAEKCVAR
jgi:hypothetical protein